MRKEGVEKINEMATCILWISTLVFVFVLVLDNQAIIDKINKERGDQSSMTHLIQPNERVAYYHHFIFCYCNYEKLKFTHSTFKTAVSHPHTLEDVICAQRPEISIKRMCHHFHHSTHTSISAFGFFLSFSQSDFQPSSAHVLFGISHMKRIKRNMHAHTEECMWSFSIFIFIFIFPTADTIDDMCNIFMHIVTSLVK
jgi:hypothetical protein